MTASEMYALSQGSSCAGQFQCHWCSSPCSSMFFHDDVLAIPFRKSVSGAKNPSSHYCCVGCWLWRRKRLCITFTDKSFKDGQCPQKHSWWVTNRDATAIQTPCPDIYDRLLNPPLQFVLSFTDGTTDNHIHHAIANDFPISIENDSRLWFTVNNIGHSFTLYELEEALRGGEGTGKEPGVQALLRLLGPAPAHLKNKPIQANQNKGRGRPQGTADPLPAYKTVKKIVTSGSPH